MLEQYVYPEIGDMAVAKNGTDDVLRELRPIWERIPETASRVRQRIEAVLDAALVKGWRTGENAAGWRRHLSGELPLPGKAKRIAQRQALPWQRVPAFMAALSERQGMAARVVRYSMICTLINVGEGTGGGMMKHPMPDAPATWLPDIEVDDIGAATEKPRSLGATLVRDVMEVPGTGSFSITVDPTGATLGL